MQLFVWNDFAVIIQKVDGKDSSELQRVAFHDPAVKHDANVIANRQLWRSCGFHCICRNKEFRANGNAAVKRLCTCAFNRAIAQFQDCRIKICLPICI